MDGAAIHRIAPSASPVGALIVRDWDRDGPGVSIPRPEVQVVVRFGVSAQNGLDVHAFGARQTVHRKFIRTGRILIARLQLGAAASVLGVPASAMAGRTLALEELWGEPATRRLRARLAGARDATEAAALLDRAIAERFVSSDQCDARAQFAIVAAGKLTSASVNTVAADLGVTARHLRRVFHEVVGMGPKAFAKLTRFHRALRAAREDAQASWATSAAAAGYYDQAHLITEFRAIADVTPGALVRELRAALLLNPG
jgi:AraC-like DNA-binding protein